MGLETHLLSSHLHFRKNQAGCGQAAPDFLHKPLEFLKPSLSQDYPGSTQDTALCHHGSPSETTPQVRIQTQVQRGEHGSQSQF